MAVRSASIFSLHTDKCFMDSSDALLALSASEEVLFTCFEISVMLADNSSTAAACSVAPSDRLCALDDILPDSSDTCVEAL